MFDGGLLVLVQVNLDQLRTVQLDADTFANDFSWEYQIFQHGIEHSGQCSGTWTLLFQWVACVTLWFWQNFSLSNENNMLSGEFLLQFTNQTGLDLLESLLLWNWNVDNDGLEY